MSKDSDSKPSGCNVSVLNLQELKIYSASAIQDCAIAVYKMLAEMHDPNIKNDALWQLDKTFSKAVEIFREDMEFFKILVADAISNDIDAENQGLSTVRFNRRFDKEFSQATKALTKRFNLPEMSQSRYH